MEYTKHTYPTEFIPLCTIVTVFGTGSEMNNGAVITNEEKKIKGALRDAQASDAFLDPEYTMSVPMRQVISGAFDTLSHAMETYFGKPDENNLSDDMNEAVMRSVIRNIRVLLKDPNNYNARSELAWASAMAENGVLKIGKVTDFQAHQNEHQLGAYTNCNHGAGLAVIHPVLYRHIYQAGAARFARFAENVWGIALKASDEETALAGVEALAAFIKEIGLTNFNLEQIREILSICRIKPAVLQTELHPYNQEPELKKFLHENTMLNIPASLEESGAVFGAVFGLRLRKIFAPLLTGNYAIGALLVFVKTLSEYGTPYTLGRRIGFYVFTTDIHRCSTTAPIDFGRSASLSSVLVCICMAMWLMQNYITNKTSYRLVSGKGSRPAKTKLSAVGQVGARLRPGRRELHP